MWEDLATVLEGSVVRLEPLASRHERGLYEVALDPRVWRWLPYDASGSREAFGAWFEEAVAASEAGREVAFVTLEARTGALVGSTRYLNLRPEHRGLEIGWTWISPSAWGTGANVEAKLLMLEHAFERFGCMRVEFQTIARNERSRNALKALPARFEGVFRKHKIWGERSATPPITASSTTSGRRSKPTSGAGLPGGTNRRRSLIPASKSLRVVG